MSDKEGGANGGWRAMNIAQRRIALGAMALFLLVAALVMVANAESTISDLSAGGGRTRSHLIWSWEWTSMIGWLSVYPAIWFAVARIRSRRLDWKVVAIVLVAGALISSGWHITVMVALRHAYYAAVGSGPYRFFGVMPDRSLYEFRKDVPTYLQFIAFAAVVQWLIARAASADVAAPSVLIVRDGSATHHVPVSEIESVSAAGNYVEIVWGSRTLLKRASLAETAAELGSAFVRVHRGALVRRDTIRSVATDKSGDFVLTLASGAAVRGTRRHRSNV